MLKLSAVILYLPSVADRLVKVFSVLKNDLEIEMWS